MTSGDQSNNSNRILIKTKKRNGIEFLQKNGLLKKMMPTSLT